jgi:hypothetical protein
LIQYNNSTEEQRALTSELLLDIDNSGQDHATKITHLAA